MKKAISFFLCLLLAGSLLGNPSVKAAGSYTVTIDPAASYQTLEGWGTSLAWWGNIIGGWSSAKRNEIIDLMFDVNGGLGFNIVRYNIGGGENALNQGPYRVGAVMPSFQPSEGVWDWNADANQRYVLQRAKVLGANIFEAFTNAPPYWMTMNGCSAGSASGGNNLKNDYYDDYAHYMTEVVKKARDEWGIHFRTIAPLNEPISTWWKCGNNQEGIHFDRDKQDLLLSEVLNQISVKGLAGVNVSGPEEYSINQTLDSYASYSSAVKQGLTQINTHTYAGDKHAQLRSLASANGEKLWVSEVGVGGSAAQSPFDMTSAQELAGKINSDLSNLQSMAWVEWQAVENRQLGHNWGFIQADFTGTEGYWVNKQYWTMANYSKFIRPGFQIIANSDRDNTLTSIDPKTGKIVIVTRNTADSDTKVTYDLSLFNSTAGTASIYRTSATENLAQLSNATISSGSLTTTLKSNSITTFIIDSSTYTGSGANLHINDAVTGTALHQFNYSTGWSNGTQAGAYMNDNHWSSSTNAVAELKFTGSQISLYGAKAPNHGIAAISINGGPEEYVDLYSVTRGEQALLYVSPLLHDGTHTLSIRVTGSKNTMATSTIIALDRAIITPSKGSLLGNFNFEGSSLSPWAGEWNPSLAGVESNYPFNGLKDGYLHPTTSQDVALYQEITAPYTGTYVLSAHAAASKVKLASLGADVNGVQAGEAIVAGTGGYNYYQLKFHAAAGSKIKVWYYAKRDNGWAVIDQVLLR